MSRLALPRLRPSHTLALAAVLSLSVQVGPAALHGAAEVVGADRLAAALAGEVTAEAAFIRRGLIKKKIGQSNYRVTTIVGDDPQDEVATVQVSLQREDGGVWQGTATSVCTGQTAPQDDYGALGGGPCGVFSVDVAPGFLTPADAGDEVVVTMTMRSSSGMVLAFPTSETVVLRGPSSEPAPEDDEVETLVRVPVLEEGGWRDVGSGEIVTADPPDSPTVAVALTTTLADGTGQVIATYDTTLTESVGAVAFFEGQAPNGNGTPNLVVRLKEGSPRVRTFPQMALDELRVAPRGDVAARVEEVEPGLLRVSVSNPADPAWDPDGPAGIESVVYGGRLHVRSGRLRYWNAGDFPDPAMLAQAAGYSLAVAAFDEAGKVTDAKARPAWQSLTSDRPLVESVAVVEGGGAPSLTVLTRNGRPTGSSLTATAVDLATGDEVLFGDAQTPLAAERQFAADVDLGVSGAGGEVLEGIVSIHDAGGVVVDQAAISVTVAEVSGGAATVATTALGHEVWVSLASAPGQGPSAGRAEVAYAGNPKDLPLYRWSHVSLELRSNAGSGAAVTADLAFDVEFARWEVDADGSGGADGLSVSVEVLDSLGDGDSLLDPEVPVPAVMYSFGKGTESSTSQASTKPRLL